MVLPAELYAIIPNLETGKSYEFRVLAVNEAGRGEPSQTSDPVTMKHTRGYFCIISCSNSNVLVFLCTRSFF